MLCIACFLLQSSAVVGSATHERSPLLERGSIPTGKKKIKPFFFIARRSLMEYSLAALAK